MTCRYIGLPLRTTLIIFILILGFLLLAFFTNKQEPTFSKASIRDTLLTDTRNVLRNQKFPSFSIPKNLNMRTFPVRSWKKRRTRWPTTERRIWTTPFSFTASRYYTYIEDFLANHDKFPMMKEEQQRTSDVVETAIRLKNRKLFTPLMTDAQKTIVYELLSSFDALAKREGIQYFAYGGTLLGSFRHHNLVPYDDDVDIIIHDNDREKLRRAVEKSPHSFAMSTLSPDHYKLFNRFGTFTNLYHDWTYPYIDISFFKLNETHLYDLAMTYGRWWAYRIEDILPLHDRPLGPLMLPSPKDTFKYLQETYADLALCSESYYSHQLEMVVRCRMVSTDCEKLPYAFVRRSAPSSGGGVNESLVLEGKVLSWSVVQEPRYQADLKNPYKLTKT